MEALVAASCAALTVYDMCKALDKGIEISDVYLLKKAGGRAVISCARARNKQEKRNDERGFRKNGEAAAGGR